jgi:hypothetical protein
MIQIFFGILVEYKKFTIYQEEVAMTTEDQARALLMRHHHLIKQREQTMLSRTAAEVGMPVEAATFWNHIQGKPHPSFRKSYDRSQATMS